MICDKQKFLKENKNLKSHKKSHQISINKKNVDNLIFRKKQSQIDLN